MISVRTFFPCFLISRSFPCARPAIFGGFAGPSCSRSIKAARYLTTMGSFGSSRTRASAAAPIFFGKSSSGRCSRHQAAATKSAMVEWLTGRPPASTASSRAGPTAPSMCQASQARNCGFGRRNRPAGSRLAESFRPVIAAAKIMKSNSASAWAAIACSSQRWSSSSPGGSSAATSRRPSWEKLKLLTSSLMWARAAVVVLFGFGILSMVYFQQIRGQTNEKRRVFCSPAKKNAARGSRERRLSFV